MKKRFKMVVTLLLLFTLTTLAACTNKDEKASGDPSKGITLKLLHNWNGSTGPKDMKNNPVAKKIFEKTGVNFDVEYTNGSEVEKVTHIFATGDLPDMYDGPAWGLESENLLKAANEDQLYDLTKYIKKYPNLGNLVKKENMSESLYDNIFSKQKGGQFMLHVAYPAASDDVLNWLYGVYVNKDIAAKAGIDPQSVHSPDELYNFLKAVKAANLKSSGNPVFPLGANGGGWPLDILSEMFVPVAGASSWMIDEDGNTQINFLTKEYENYILYMRKLLSEGLLDPEAYTQTNEIATEKLAQGRIAVIPNQFNGLWAALLKLNMQDKYVPLGPLNDFNGDPYRTEVNVTGSQLIAIPKTTSKEKLDAAMKVLNYLASDEGFLLANYGVEGVHYEMKDGKVEAKKEWVDKLKDDPDALKNEGIDTVYTDLAGQFRRVSLGGGPYGYQYDEKYKVEVEFKKIMTPNGIKPATGKDPNLVLKESEYYEQLQPVLDTLGDVVLQAIHAKTENQAMDVIKASQKALKNANVEKVAAEIEKQAKAGTEFMRYRTSN